MQGASLTVAISLAGQGYCDELKHCRRLISGEESGLDGEWAMEGRGTPRGIG